MNLKPIGDRVIVKRETAEGKSSGGIIIPDTAKEKPMRGTVIAVGPGRHHYVVVLAWANGRILFHDPAVAPFRVMAEEPWHRAWSATGNWALLVLPGDGRRVGWLFTCQ
jgi:hypothetical protein